MDWTHARRRFAFLAEALEGVGGFAPVTHWTLLQSADLNAVPPVPARHGYSLSGPSHLIRYPRESDDKFAARNALAVYENHLAEACERFTGFLSRKAPSRLNADSPFVSLMVADADMRGSTLDVFFSHFARQARARGSMLLVLDTPDDQPLNLADQIARRAVPYLRACEPERVTAFDLDPSSGLFRSVSFESEEVADGKVKCVIRTYDAEGWSIADERGNVIRAGVHAFGACPVLAFTETGGLFPVVGVYAQIADLSRDLFNLASELREQERATCFPLLHMQVPPEHASQFNGARTAAVIGAHSIIVHSGDAPGFISPDGASADVLMKTIAAREASIKRISKDDAAGAGTTQAESGEAKRRRFEELNSQLATFARGLQSLEVRMWTLFHRAIGQAPRLRVEWPTDFNLADTLAELDILTMMQSTGFPPAALTAKREAIAGQEFDAADPATKETVLAAIREQAQQNQTGGLPGGQMNNPAA